MDTVWWTQFPDCLMFVSGWCFGTWILFCPFIVKNNPNWLIIIPTDYRETTNQILFPSKIIEYRISISLSRRVIMDPCMDWTKTKLFYLVAPNGEKKLEANLGWVVGQHRRPCGFIVFLVFRDWFIVVMFTWVGWGGAITSLALGGLQMLRWWRVGWSGVGWGKNVTCTA